MPHWTICLLCCGFARSIPELLEKLVTTYLYKVTRKLTQEVWLQQIWMKNIHLHWRFVAKRSNYCTNVLQYLYSSTPVSNTKKLNNILKFKILYTQWFHYNKSKKNNLQCKQWHYHVRLCQNVKFYKRDWYLRLETNIYPNPNR